MIEVDGCDFSPEPLCPSCWPCEAMRTTEFDSSSEDEEVGEEHLSPLHISWWVSAASLHTVIQKCLSVCSEMKKISPCVFRFSLIWLSGYPCPSWSVRSFLGYVPCRVKASVYHITCIFLHIYVVLLKDFLKLDVKMAILSADRLQIQRHPQESGERYP